MKAVTANRLRDGRVVYRLPGGGWTVTLSAAARLEDADSEAALAEALAQEGEVVGAYLIEVDAHGPDGQKRSREIIRQTGPSAGTTKARVGDAHVSL